MTEEVSKYKVIKLKTGEILFAKLSDNFGDGKLYVVDPIRYEVENINGNAVKAFSVWMTDLTDEKEIPLNISDISVMVPLSKEHMQNYGKALMQILMFEMQKEMFQNMTGNRENDYLKCLGIVKQCKDEAVVISEEFKIELPPFEDIEKGLEDIKPVYH